MNLGEEAILSLPWQSGASESATVCFLSSLSICYWLFKCGVLRFVCARTWVCVWERDTVESVLIMACVQTHTSFITVRHATPFPSLPWNDGKTKDIINCLCIYFESWSSRLWKGALHFWRVLAVFGQSQCTVPVGQSEQSVLVGRRDFVENDAFERGGA